jgi:hypothetical protein
MALDSAASILAVLVAFVGLVVLWRVLVPYGLYAAMPSLAEYPADPAESERESDLMLRRMLSAVDFEYLAKHGCLDVRSPSRPQRFYRIPRGQGLVKVFERDRLIMRLCVQPTKWLPSGDLVAMHKFSIEANEDEYLRVAVRHFAYGSAKPFVRHAPPAG